MGRRSIGIRFDAERRKWEVDKVHRGQRLRFRGDSRQEAEAWLIEQCATIDAYGPIRSKADQFTFEQAVVRYLLQELRAEKVSLETETYLLKPLIEQVGNKPLDQIHDATLKPFTDARLQAGIAHKTINSALGVVRHILNVAHESWRVDIGGGKTKPLLAQVPKITMLPLTGHQRAPRPITWEEQRRLLPLLPLHLERMALFVVNTGVRDSVACNLRWEWELRLELDGVVMSVFEVPAINVKGRKSKRYIVCNSVAQAVIESVRGRHDEFVFAWRRERVTKKELPPKMPYRPIQTMLNTAWETARTKAGLPDLHVHDLRHTVGMRLREAGVSENTIADVLWHSRGNNITLHYSVAQVRELKEALELIKDDSGRKNVSLHMLALQSRAAPARQEQKVPRIDLLPPRSLQERKMA